MKLFHFLLLNAACLLFLGPNLKANNLTSLSDAPETTYSCNLPAPANVQSNQPSATIADFSWNAVPGAWGYRGTLVNTSNGSSTMQVVTNNAASFSVTPGQTYVFHVVAACSATNYSDAAAEVNFKAEFIVIDLIAELNCPVDGREIKDTDPSTPDVWDFNWVIDQQYIIEFTKNGENGGNQQAWVGFKLNSMGHFEIRKLTEDPITAELCGLPIGSASGCQMAPSFPGMVVSCSNASFSCYNRKALMAVLVFD